MQFLLRLLLTFYQLLLRAYPCSFRIAFEDEMQAVFAERLEAAAREGFGVLASAGLQDLFETLLAALRARRRSRGDLFARLKETLVHLLQAAGSDPSRPGKEDGRAHPGRTQDGRTSWKQALLELSLFLLAGSLLVLFTYLPPARLEAGWGRQLEILGVIIACLPVPIFLAGLGRGLPRWAYPSGGLLLGYCFVASAWLGLFPLFAAALLAAFCLALVAAAVHARSGLLPSAVQAWGRSLGEDFTRLSFASYGLLPLAVIIAFDDAYLNSRTPCLAAAVLCMLLGALAYIRIRPPVLQIAALLAGMTGSLGMASLDWALTAGSLDGMGWLWRLWLNLAALLLAPLLAGWLQRSWRPGHVH